MNVKTEQQHFFKYFRCFFKILTCVTAAPGGNLAGEIVVLMQILCIRISKYLPFAEMDIANTAWPHQMVCEQVS